MPGQRRQRREPVGARPDDGDATAGEAVHVERGVRWDIDRGRRRRRLRAGNRRLDGRRAELRQEVLLTWKSMEMARLRIEALSQGSVREAEAALRVAQAAYRFGERGILDVLDAQRVLRSVRADLIEARYQLQEARVLLDRLTGQPIEHSPS